MAIGEEGDAGRETGKQVNKTENCELTCVNMQASVNKCMNTHVMKQILLKVKQRYWHTHTEFISLIKVHKQTHRSYGFKVIKTQTHGMHEVKPESGILHTPISPSTPRSLRKGRALCKESKWDM